MNQREQLLHAMAETYRLPTNECPYLLDVILDFVETHSEELSREYWGGDTKWGAGSSDKEPWEEGTVSAILRSIVRKLR